MKIQELEHLAEDGVLFVERYFIGERTRLKQYPSEEKVKYKRFIYFAWIEDMEGKWKIRKGDMKILVGKGAVDKSLPFSKEEGYNLR